MASTRIFWASHASKLIIYSHECEYPGFDVDGLHAGLSHPDSNKSHLSNCNDETED